MKCKTYKEFTSELVNEEEIKKGDYVRYKYKGNITGGHVVLIKGLKAKVRNWDGSTQSLILKDLEYIPSWNPLGPKESVNEVRKAGVLRSFPKVIKVNKKIYLSDDKWRAVGYGDIKYGTYTIPANSRLEFQEIVSGGGKYKGGEYGSYYDADDDSYPEFSLANINYLGKERSIITESKELVNEGAMSDIHIMAKDAKTEADFIKAFLKAYSDKVKNNPDTRKWLSDIYSDTAN